MNIEQMAYDAGLVNLSPAVYTDGSEGVTRASLERFAALVRAQALEEAAAACERRIQYWKRDDIRRYEDEVCAKIIRALKSDSKPLP